MKNKKLTETIGFETTNVDSKSQFLVEMRMKNIGLLGFFFDFKN